MEEKQITPEEAFFSAKANLELAITAQLKEFAAKFCTSVIFKGCVEVQPYVSETGKVIDTRISHVEVETKYKSPGIYLLVPSLQPANVNPSLVKLQR